MKTENLSLVRKQQSRIMKAAEACFIQNGLAHTTMRDIALEANMSLGNIYRYFKNKQQLIKAFIENDNQELHDAFLLLESSQQFNKTLCAIAQEYIEDLSKKAALGIYIDVISEALRNQEIADLIELDKGEKILHQVLENSLAQGKIEALLPPEVAALTIIAFIENAAIKCAFNKGYTVDLAASQFKKLLGTLIRA